MFTITITIMYGIIIFIQPYCLIAPLHFASCYTDMNPYFLVKSSCPQFHWAY